MTPAQTTIIVIFAIIVLAIAIHYIDMKKILRLVREAYGKVFRKKKRRFDLYVHGNLISNGYLACWSKPAGIEGNVPYEEIDPMYGIIIEGDMIVDNLYTRNKKVGVSGYTSGRGAMVKSKHNNPLHNHAHGVDYGRKFDNSSSNRQWKTGDEGSSSGSTF